MVKKMGLIVLLAALSGVASADPTCKVEHFLLFTWLDCTNTGGGGTTTVAPEMDPASTATGLTLALGGLVVLGARRARSAK
jgi:hypothetical protein